jgi:pyruvate-formate lyase-activating enzyme
MKLRAGPCGVHFFDRRTGLNILADEVQVPRRLWATAPRQVSIALTNACDLSCPHCYAPKNPATLEFANVASWLDDLDRNGCLGIGFGGGEPTLHPRLPQLCDHAAKKTGLAVTFTTHAHRVDGVLMSALKGNVHFIRVSMDGVGATYEALRGRSFILLRARLEEIRTLAPFGINFVVNARTLPDLDAAIILAAEMGAREFLLLPEQPVTNAGGIDSRTLQALQAWIMRYDGPVPLAISERESEGVPANRAVAKETGSWAYAHIDASGVLKRSSYSHDGVRIGQHGVMEALSLLRTLYKEELT